MSPPEVWGPAVWTLFHTLIEKMNPNAYTHVIGSMFGMIIRICKVLPCPECSNDASNFLAKIKLSDYKTKDEFKNMLYLFHNWVNAKKRKPLYNYSNLQKYTGFNLIFVLNNFIAKYNTKGNMKLLAESFQRSFVVKDLVSWFKTYVRAFIQPTIIDYPKQINDEPVIKEEPTIIEEQPLSEEEPTITKEEPTITEEQTIVEEEQTIVEEEQTTETENQESNTVSDENHSDENTNIEEIYSNKEEDVVEEHIIIKQPKKKRTGKLKKK